MHRLSGGKLSVRDVGGLSILSDGRSEIAITSLRRRVKYEYGISARRQVLANQYRLGSLVPIKRGQFCINCGANVGEVSLWLAERGATVLAVEPDPKTLAALRWNTASQPAIEVVAAGLWNANTELTFYQAPESADTSAINEVGSPVAVSAFTLDTLMEQRDGPVQVLVGDAEGAEPEVFEGALNTLRRTRYVAFDVGPERRGSKTAAACWEILAGLGFERLALTRHNKLIAVNPQLR